MTDKIRLSVIKRFVKREEEIIRLFALFRAVGGEPRTFSLSCPGLLSLSYGLFWIGSILDSFYLVREKGAMRKNHFTV
jgi:hypothetical protein